MATAPVQEWLQQPWFTDLTREEHQWLEHVAAANAEDFPRYLKAMPKVQSHPPETPEERRLVAGAWSHRGRGELVRICGASANAVRLVAHSVPTLTFLYRHIADESHHSVEMIQ